MPALNAREITRLYGDENAGEMGLQAKTSAFGNPKTNRVALKAINNVQRPTLDRACKTQANINIHATFQGRAPTQPKGFSIFVEPQYADDIELQSDILRLHTSDASDDVAESPMKISPVQAKDNGLETRLTSQKPRNDEWSEYEDDIVRYLSKRAVKTAPRSTYMNKQPDINYNMRAILIDWLAEVSDEFGLDNRTLYLAVTHIDRFLSVMSVQRDKLQLVGTACLFIAAKYEEIYPPEASDFVFITDDTYTQEQLFRMEQLIVKALDCDVSAPIILDFLDPLLAAAGCTVDEQTQSSSKYKALGHLAMFLCELTLQDSSKFLKYLPHVIAASAILLSSHTMSLPIASDTLVMKCNADRKTLLNCMDDLQDAFMEAPALKYKAIFLKYSKDSFDCVARIPPVARPFTYVL